MEACFDHFIPHESQHSSSQPAFTIQQVNSLWINMNAAKTT